MSTKVAALYVEADGIYAGLPNVDLWDETRDARLYAGPWPVVAHPPCQRWCQLAPVNQKRWGTPIGEDGGTFASALAAVRRWGGVLEHPAYSLAWSRYGLPRPTRGGWSQCFNDPGMVTEISQVAYGHDSRKRTWLYAVGVTPVVMDWREPTARCVVGAGVHSGQSMGRPRDDRSLHTPVAFRDVLVDLARSAAPREEGKQ